MPKQQRGFAVMDPEVRRRIAALGGRSVPHYKRNWVRRPDQAKIAGAKGGLVSRKKQGEQAMDRAIAATKEVFDAQ